MKNKKAIAAAIARHNRRQARREHPDGTFDRAKRWHPSDAEAAGCAHVRSPTRSFPYSELTACRSLRACALLEKANVNDCRSVKSTLSKRGFDVAKMYDEKDVLAAMKDGLRKNWTLTAQPVQADDAHEKEADDDGADLS